jgi:trehalose/maltose hydrolase-like predicted phosphorylase
MQKEIHINGDVAWMLDNAAALGLVKPQDAENVIKKVATFFNAMATKRQDGKYDLKDVVSPDEFHTGDNDLYTNLLANWTQKKTNSKAQFYLPRDKETYLTYDNDPIRGYKQAAAVLGIYPLQMINNAEARKMMDRYADKVTKNGPAMSHSVHALIWARLGETEKAYDEWKKSWQLYTNHPLMLFSEKPKKKTTYFTTGAAGCLQTVLYGFLGFRIDYEKDKMAAWSTPLNNGKWISIRPRLPAKWKSVKFTNFIVKGKRYNLTIDASGVKVNQGEP